MMKIFFEWIIFLFFLSHHLFKALLVLLLYIYDVNMDETQYIWQYIYIYKRSNTHTQAKPWEIFLSKIYFWIWWTLFVLVRVCDIIGRSKFEFYERMKMWKMDNFYSFFYSLFFYLSIIQHTAIATFILL